MIADNCHLNNWVAIDSLALPPRIPEISEVPLYPIDLCRILRAPIGQVRVDDVGRIPTFPLVRPVGSYADYCGDASPPSTYDETAQSQFSDTEIPVGRVSAQENERPPAATALDTIFAPSELKNANSMSARFALCPRGCLAISTKASAVVK